MVMILLGPPGCGKGTISSFLKTNNNIIHISTGDIFRKILHCNCSLAIEIKKVIESGKLVSDDLTNKLLLSELKKYDLDKDNILLDGYPRNIYQLKFLEKIHKIDFAFDIYVANEILTKRIIGRRICPKCNQIYNIYFKKPKEIDKCDLCHSKLIIRKDDNEITAKSRFELYQKVNSILINECKKMGIYYQINNNTLDSAIKQIKEISKI